MHNCKACFKRRILHASNSIVSIMYMLSATSETIKFDVSKCGRPKLKARFHEREILREKLFMRNTDGWA